MFILIWTIPDNIDLKPQDRKLFKEDFIPNKIKMNIPKKLISLQVLKYIKILPRIGSQTKNLHLLLAKLGQRLNRFHPSLNNT
jgi:hypothetical protein